MDLPLYNEPANGIIEDVVDDDDEFLNEIIRLT
jgi:hypothetical protein